MEKTLNSTETTYTEATNPIPKLQLYKRFVLNELHKREHSEKEKEAQQYEEIKQKLFAKELPNEEQSHQMQGKIE